MRLFQILIGFVYILLFAGCKDTNNRVVGLLDPNFNGDSFLTSTWSFSSAGDYTFDSNYINFTAGVISLQQVDTVHDSTNDFTIGTHTGTYWRADSELTLLFEKNSPSLDVRQIFPSLAMDLVAYWPMENNFNDVSGSGNHLTIGGGATHSTVSQVGAYAAAFVHPSNAYVDNSSMMPTSTLTFSAWVYPAVLSNGRRVIAGNSIEGGGESITVLVGTDNTSWRFNVRQSDNTEIDVSTLIPISVNSWSHIALVADGTHLNFYVDGNLGKKVSYNGTILPVTTCWSIGARPRQADCSGRDQGWDGKIDEVAIWSEALTLDQVKTLYSTQSLIFNDISPSWTPHFDSLIGYWKMDGNWLDSSGNMKHGSPFGSLTGFVTTGKVGSHFASFDGSNDDYITTTAIGPSGASPRTMMAWIRSSSPNDRPFFGYGDNDSGTGRVISASIVNVNTVRISFDGHTLNFPFDALKWNHFALVVPAAAVVTSDVKLYLNGQLVTPSSTSGAVAPVNTSAPLDFTIASIPERIGLTSFSGDLDDVSLWNTDLSAADIDLIYNRQKQKYSGSYDSPVIDLGTSGVWSSITTKNPLPFHKEIVTQSSETSTNYSSISGDLANGLIGYWPLNESTTGTGSGGSDFSDKSSSGVDLVLTSGSIGGYGVLSNGLQDARANGGDNYSFVGTTAFTVSGWVRSTVTGAGNFYTIFQKRDQDGSLLYQGWTCFINGNLGRLECTRTVDDVQYEVRTNSTDMNNGEWYHFTFTYDGSVKKLFINGEEVDSQPDGRPLVNLGVDLLVGDDADDGTVDELAIWSRVLSEAEIVQLYRRGANRIKYQVKSCVDPSCSCTSYSIAPQGSATDCDGDGILNSTDTDDTHMTVWLGPNNSSGEYYFSELHNNTNLDSTTGAPTGYAHSLPLNLNFTDFPAAGKPVDNRYFQYRVLMEADDNNACGGGTCLPSLTSVSVGPVGRYYGGGPSIVNNTAINFAQLKAMSDADVGSCTTYQLSRDGGTTWQWWDGMNWATTANGTSESNSIDDFIASRLNLLTGGSFKFKAFLNTNISGGMTNSCTLNSVEIKYEQ